MKYLYYLLIYLSLISVSFAKNDANILNISEPTKYIAQDFDVLDYSAELEFPVLAEKSLIAVNEVTLRWLTRQDTSKFYFHLRGLNVDSVFYDAVKVQYSKVGDSTSATMHFEVAPPKSNLNDTAKIRIYYSGIMTNEGKLQPWGGVHYDDTLLYALGVGFLNNYVGTTQHWLACYDLPSDKATFHGKFIVPKGNNVAVGGELDSLDKSSDERDIYYYSYNYPTATYLLTFNIGELEELKFDGASVPISVFANPKDTTAARFAFKMVPEMVTYFSETFGPYPFTKVGYVLTKKGSMESQEMINYYKALCWSHYSKKDSSNTTAAHELSHMWFGNSVTPFDYRDAWLNESWATFSEALWMSHFANYSAYLSFLDSKRSLYINNLTKIEGVIPLYDFPRNSATSNYPSTIYMKGAVVVSMLRWKLGDSLFFRGLTGFLKKYKYSNMTSEMLQTLFEQISSKNLDQFFDQWVYNPGWPKINAKVIYRGMDGDNYLGETLILEQTQTEGWGFQKGGYFFDLPIEVTFKQKDGTRHDTVFYLNGDMKTVPLNQEKYYTLEINRGINQKALMETTGIEYLDATSVEESNSIANLHYSIFNKTLFINFVKSTNYELQIFDLLGNAIFNTQSYNSNEIIADLNSYINGVYYFIITANGKVLVKDKLILY